MSESMQSTITLLTKWIDLRPVIRQEAWKSNLADALMEAGMTIYEAHTAAENLNLALLAHLRKAVSPPSTEDGKKPASKKLLSFPKLDEFPGNQWNDYDYKSYYKALADFWERRCRLAVDALDMINAAGNGSSFMFGSNNYNPVMVAQGCMDLANETLDEIGELPPEGST